MIDKDTQYHPNPNVPCGNGLCDGACRKCDPPRMEQCDGCGCKGTDLEKSGYYFYCHECS